jgi:hypothetical protein
MRKMILAVAVATAVPFMLSMSGCAFDVIHVEQTTAKLETSSACGQDFRLVEAVEIRLTGGYSRSLKKDTRWNCVGTIEQGHVYRTKDQILTVEASNIYEAYIVISDNKLVGFYLPVEHSFSPLKDPLPLTIVKSTQSKTKDE